MMEISLSERDFIGPALRRTEIHPPNTTEVSITGQDVSKVTHATLKGQIVARGIEPDAIKQIYIYSDGRKFYVTLESPGAEAFLQRLHGQTFAFETLRVTLHYSDSRRAFQTGTTVGTESIKEQLYFKPSSEFYLQDYFVSCPFYSQRVENTCHLPTVSCAGRCGDFMDQILSNASVCSCDGFCQAIGDCCWDFETECPEHIGQHYHYFQFDNTTCETDTLIIEGCRDHTDKVSSRSEWYKLPLVTDRKWGLTFRNADVYISCLFNETVSRGDSMVSTNLNNYSKDSAEDVLVFWKKIFYSYSHLAVGNIMKLVINGTDGVEAGFYNFPPIDMRKRACTDHNNLLMHCMDPGDTHICRLSSHLILESMSRVCGTMYSTSLSTPSTELTSAFTAFSTVTIAFPRGITVVKLESSDNNTCYLYQGIPFRDKTKHNFHFSFIANFNEKDVGMVEYVESGSVSWEMIRCHHQNLKNSCELFCKRGYVLFGFECLHPINITIQAVGENMPDLVKVLRGIYSRILQAFDGQITLQKEFHVFVEYVTIERNVFHLKFQSKFSLYDVYQEGSGLPVTSLAIEYLKKADVQFSMLYQVTICMGLVKDANFVEIDSMTEGDVITSCDDILSFLNNLNIQDFTDNATSSLANWYKENQYGYFSLMAMVMAIHYVQSDISLAM